MMTGDLQNTPVVINLSLVVTPYDDIVSQYKLILGTHGDSQPDDNLRVGLHTVIQSLTTSGAAIVAAAGNDSHTPDMPDRMGPRHPAAFSEVISVAAVIGDQKETAAAYSNRATSPEQPNGIATYGGRVAIPVTPASAESQLPPVAPQPITCMTGAKNIDALIGVYSSPTYPKLAGKDCQKSYNAPNTNAWAYWSGTSFATPIISALVARILQKAKENNVLSALSSQQIIATINSDTVLPSGLPKNVELGDVGVLRAEQKCYPATIE